MTGTADDEAGLLYVSRVGFAGNTKTCNKTTMTTRLGGGGHRTQGEMKKRQTLPKVNAGVCVFCWTWRSSEQEAADKLPGIVRKTRTLGRTDRYRSMDGGLLLNSSPVLVPVFFLPMIIQPNIVVITTTQEER